MLQLLTYFHKLLPFPNTANSSHPLFMGLVGGGDWSECLTGWLMAVSNSTTNTFFYSENLLEHP